MENLCDMDLINKMVSRCPSQASGQHVRAAHPLCAFVPQGQTAFDVADEDVLGYLEELQKKQTLVSPCTWPWCQTVVLMQKQKFCRTLCM